MPNLDRRQFCGVSLAGFSMLLTGQSLGLTSLDNQSATKLPLVIPDHILALETQLQAQAGHFSWYLHNELRHHYLAVSERQSRLHADIILAHSIMDGYILNTLSDWHFTDNEPALGIAALVSNAELYPNFVHVKAASLIKVGDVYREYGRFSQATQLYEYVSNMDAFSLWPNTNLSTYRVLAQNRMLM